MRYEYPSNDEAIASRLAEEDEKQTRKRRSKKKREKSTKVVKQTSSIWNCYRTASGGAASRQVKQVVCRFCLTTRSVSGRTSNLLEHMRKDHLREWEEIETAAAAGGVMNAEKAIDTLLEKRQTSSSAPIQKKLSFFQNRAKKKEGLFRKESALTMWAVDKNVPFNAL